MKTLAVALLSILFAPTGLLAGPDTTSVTSPAGHFRIHIDPWISLHHFAYHYVRDLETELRLRGDVPLSEEDRQALTAEFQSACTPLREAYLPYIRGSLLYDRKTRDLAKALWQGPEALSDIAVREALESCMPAYQLTLWPRHRDASTAFVEQLLASLELYEDDMARMMKESLDGQWPEQPIRVDITAYANWAGAYTDDWPPNITLSSDDATVDRFKFEMLFHESAHTGAFGESIESAANTAMQEAGFKNDRFWHYVLFYVTGRVVADVTGDESYVPYSVAVGNTQRASAAPFYRALEQTWDEGGTFRDRVLRAALAVGSESK